MQLVVYLVFELTQTFDYVHLSAFNAQKNVTRSVRPAVNPLTEKESTINEKKQAWNQAILANA